MALEHSTKRESCYSCTLRFPGSENLVISTRKNDKKGNKKNVPKAALSQNGK